MKNEDGFKRDLAILNDWKDKLTTEEYNEYLKELYSDYGIKENK